MKKYLFFAGLLALSLGFTACGDDDDDNGGESSKQAVTLTAANYANESAYMELTSAGEQLILDLIDEEGASNNLNALPAAIDFTASGDAIIRLADGVYSEEGEGIYAEISTNRGIASLFADYTKGNVPFQYIKSTYTHSGDTYTISNYGTVKTATGGRVNISLTSEGFSDNFNGSLTVGGATNGNNTTYLCRKWTISNVEVKASNGTQSFTASSTLYNIVSTIINQGYLNMDARDMTNYDQFGRFLNLYFSQNDRLVVLFGNNKIYTGSWNWNNVSKGTLKYTLDDSFMGNVLFPNGSTSCTAEFSGNTGTFTLSSSYSYNKKTYSFSVIFTLK